MPSSPIKDLHRQVNAHAGRTQYDRAANLVAADDVEGGARIFYNRGLVRFALGRDKQDAIADVEEALRRKPDYPQAKESLRALKGKARWVPW